MVAIKTKNLSGLTNNDESKLHQEGWTVSKDKRTGKPSNVTLVGARIGTPKEPGDLIVEGNLIKSYTSVSVRGGESFPISREKTVNVVQSVGLQGTVEITLPTKPEEGHTVIVKDGGNASNCPLRISSGRQGILVDGATHVWIPVDYGYRQFVWVGDSWLTLGSNMSDSNLFFNSNSITSTRWNPGNTSFMHPGSSTGATSTASPRVLIPKSGIVGFVRFNSSGGGAPSGSANYYVDVVKNGTIAFSTPTIDVGGTVTSQSAWTKVATGDYVQMQVRIGTVAVTTSPGNLSGCMTYTTLNYTSINS